MSRRENIPTDKVVRLKDTKLIQQMLIDLGSGCKEELDSASADELAAIWSAPAGQSDAAYIHTVLCQIGLPRGETKALEYERRYRNAHLLINAGKLFYGEDQGWVQQGLPYGPYARLIMNLLTTKAVKNRSPVVEISRSATEFLRNELGRSVGGSQHMLMVRQLNNLAACTLQLGGQYVDGRSLTTGGKPFLAFDGWSDSRGKPVLWPGQMVFSADHYNALLNGAAVPLDQRHIIWLSKNGRSLAIDVYWWFAQRLHRITEPGGIPIGWKALKEQFGQDYKNIADFRKEFKRALDQVLLVYREARVEKIWHGIRLYNSRPPIPQKATFFLAR